MDISKMVSISKSANRAERPCKGDGQMAKAVKKVDRMELINQLQSVMHMVSDIRWKEQNRNFSELDDKVFEAYIALNKALRAEGDKALEELKATMKEAEKWLEAN